MVSKLDTKSGMAKKVHVTLVATVLLLNYRGLLDGLLLVIPTLRESFFSRDLRDLYKHTHLLTKVTFFKH
jgi:hypothetical protein